MDNTEDNSSSTSITSVESDKEEINNETSETNDPITRTDDYYNEIPPIDEDNPLNTLNLSLLTSSDSQLNTRESTIPSENWLFGGSLGSRNASLIFKSSALANSSELLIQEKPGYKLHVTYKVSQAETKLLSKLLLCHGITEAGNNSSDFNLLWTGSHPKPGTFRSLQSHQRVNHFPRAYELTRKDRLYKNIEKMQRFKGHRHFDFIPQTFIMPIEYNELCSVHHRIKGPWIIKPVASSRGRGIFIVESPTDVPLEEPVVVAKYIANPLLVAGHKCDLRLYVAVTSFDPLIVYIYEEGLVRFATVKYDASHNQLWNPCMHLCNYSINKYHSDYIKSDDPGAENVGHKWTLSALLRALKAEGKDTATLMSSIEDLIIKAVLASANSIISACQMFVPHINNCFELYGFDILVDADLKPWLLEINLSPSLGCDSPLDVRLKSAMLADLLTLIGIPAVDPMVKQSTIHFHSIKNNSKGNLTNCRHVHSADGLSNTLPKKNGNNNNNNNGRLTSNSLTLTAEESRIVKMAKQQFDRRGGFVRIFPAVDSWSKYAQYLDPTTGIPISGNVPTSTYSLITPHNFNMLLHQYLFPDVQITPISKNERVYNRVNSMERKTKLVDHHMNSGNESRQNRYERMLSQGHRSSLLPQKNTDNPPLELRRQIIDLFKNGKKLTQCETRKTFSHYLTCVLKRISSEKDQDEHVDVVLKFLQKASNYLRTPFSVKTPSHKLDPKDRTAIIAKQLNDFLYLYNRETEMFVDKIEGPSQVPLKLYLDFLENARECDLEEILIYQTTQNVPTNAKKSGFPGILKCIPNVSKNYGVKPTYKLAKNNKSLKVSSLS